MREDADRVGADAEVGGVAEGDQAAVAEDQVQADAAMAKIMMRRNRST